MEVIEFMDTEAKCKITIIGIGPGSASLLTDEARSELRKSDIVVGYRLYLELLAPLISGQKLASFEIGQEEERVKFAIDQSLTGKHVSVVSSGDAGIYGMGGLVLEKLTDLKLIHSVTVRIIPGVSSLSSSSSLLGAPLMNDFCVMSLSDRITPWSSIEKRINGAISGDFVMVFYNPSSNTRRDIFEKAVNLLKEKLKPGTPVGLVKNAYRDGQAVTITTLEKLYENEVDMLTTVVIGNSSTFVSGRFMITPRGYLQQTGKSRHGSAIR